MKKLTTEEFIEKANKEHGVGTYDYSKSEYINNRTKIEIICLKHGSFWQTPSNHLNGQDCPFCAIEKHAKQQYLTLEEFIKKANKKHGIGTYDYSKVNYIDSQTKVEIICPKHNSFYQIPTSHLQGTGCPICGGKIKLTKNSFINKSKKIHKFVYDYSKVNYINNRIKVCIICSEHGEFWQTPSNHLNGDECPICAKLLMGKLRKYTSEKFIEKANEVHNYKYDYSKIKYNDSNSKIEIICPKHGSFWQKPSSHLQGIGCPKCNSSKGENFIRIFLIDNEIEFEEQKKFKNCKFERNLMFDFYISKLNLCIEYDGECHFKKINWNGRLTEKEMKENLESYQHRDKLKTEFCKNNNINLIRIKYNDDLFEILNKIVDCYDKNEYDKSLNY